MTKDLSNYQFNRYSEPPLLHEHLRFKTSKRFILRMHQTNLW